MAKFELQLPTDIINDIEFVNDNSKSTDVEKEQNVTRLNQLWDEAGDDVEFKAFVARFVKNASVALPHNNELISKILESKNAYILKFDESNIAKKIINKLDINKMLSKAMIEKKPSVFRKPLFVFLYWFIFNTCIFKCNKCIFTRSDKKLYRSFVQKAFSVLKRMLGR